MVLSESYNKTSDSLQLAGKSCLLLIHLFKLDLGSYHRKLHFLCGFVAKTLRGCLERYERITNNARFWSVRWKAWRES